jgi:ribosomal protein S17
VKAAFGTKRWLLVPVTGQCSMWSTMARGRHAEGLVVRDRHRKAAVASGGRHAEGMVVRDRHRKATVASSGRHAEGVHC